MTDAILNIINDRITHASINGRTEAASALRELRENIWRLQCEKTYGKEEKLIRQTAGAQPPGLPASTQG